MKLEKLSMKSVLVNSDLQKILNKIDAYQESVKTVKEKIICIRYKANIVWYQRKFNDALVDYFRCLELAKQIKDTLMLAQLNQDIAETYEATSSLELGIKHHYYALKFIKEESSKPQLSNIYNSLGNCYKDLQKNDSALKYHERALAIRNELHDKRGLSFSYNNLGLVHLHSSNYSKAEEYFNKSLEIKRELNDFMGISGSLINLSKIYQLKKDFKKAIYYLQEGVPIAYKANAGNHYLNGVGALAESYFMMGNFEESAVWYKRFIKVSDSLKDARVRKNIAELSTKYELEQKDAELLLKDAIVKSTSAENSKQRVLIVASSVALILCLIAIFFIYRSFQLNKRNAKVLAEKNHLIEEKNKEITDSINYAKLIQQSLLASKDMLDRNLKEYFILYKPKDIVSGDFYWASETKNGFSIACVDCTGHGVPGAFMSLIGKENLDKATAKYDDPGKILSELNRGVKRSLNQDVSGGKDGMDAALIKLEFNSTVNTIKYAGANRPLWIVSNKELKETKATKNAVGGITSDDVVFEEHIIHVSKGDMIYISTDGFADQFGNHNNKKLTTRRFKELLISLSENEVGLQREELESFFSKWKGNNEQLDDLLVIGIRV